MTVFDVGYSCVSVDGVLTWFSNMVEQVFHYYGINYFRRCSGGYIAVPRVSWVSRVNIV